MWLGKSLSKTLLICVLNSINFSGQPLCICDDTVCHKNNTFLKSTQIKACIAKLL